jgi:4-hydroxybenzoate polyprenyltransferase/phosphoserine phosphatase
MSGAPALAAAVATEKSVRPLCVDLDGTLIRSDLLIEAVFVLLKSNLLYGLLLPVWLLRGKAYLKQQVADRVDLEVTLLPYDAAFLGYLRTQRAQGRRLVLATASNIKYAEQIAFHLGLFDEVLASDADTNLSGSRKRDRLVAAFGERGFDYAGNHAVDLAIWSHAGAAVLVNAPPELARRAEAVVPVAEVFAAARPGLKVYLNALRLHQWLKNLLVFVPLTMAHQFHEPALVLRAGLAFLAFGLCASSVYVLNDLLDLASDRKHPSKRLRAFAAGTLPIEHGVLVIPVLFGAAFALALRLPGWFPVTLGVYYALTLAYSLRLKQAVLVDVLALAVLYTLRVIAGGAATDLGPSFWLLAFSMFLFLSLALVKRYSELLLVQAQDKETAAGRGYQVIDLEALAQFGIASGYLAVLVLALYINSTAVGALYRHPEAIWLICPLMLYWISRVWLLARRNAMHEDPILFAIEDRRSHWLFAIMLAIVWAAV